jgi:TfoX/Sxy family transcriptional regulator of competence genes
VVRFTEVVERHPRLVSKRMFGYDCTWVNGNMATGLFADTWFVRVGEAAAELLAMPGAVPFAPMGGTPTKGYACLPPSVIADDAALDAWLERCVAFIATLPPKG